MTRSMTDSLKGRRKGRDTRFKRKTLPPKSSGSSAYRQERFAISARLRAEKKLSAEAAMEVLIRLQQATTKRRANVRRLEESAALTLQRFARYVQSAFKPTFSSELENWSSAQDMKPYIVYPTKTSIGGFGVDGHGLQGCQLRDSVEALPEHIKNMSATDPSTFLDLLKELCKYEKGGGMATAFSASQSKSLSGERQWTVQIASRGDYAFWAMLPDGTVREIKYHLPDEDLCATPGYFIKPGRTPKFIMTPDDKIAITVKGRKAVYAKCTSSGAEIAAFAGIR